MEKFQNKYTIIKINVKDGYSKSFSNYLKGLLTGTDIIVETTKVPNMIFTKDYWFPCNLDIKVVKKKLTFQEYVDCVKNPTQEN